MTPAASAGDFDLSLQTFDASSNITITGTVTGINSGETAVSIANKIQSQFTTIITQYGGLYNGVASNITDGPAASFRITRTEHVLCFFSECAFELIVDTDTGTLFNKNSDPTLVTVTEGRSLAAILGVDFEDIDGDAFTDSEVATLLGIVSAKVIAYTNNPIVASTYRHEEFPFDRRGVKVSKTPVLSVDMPSILDPYAFINLIETPWSDYHVETGGWIIWRSAQDIVNAWEPFSYGNTVRLTYVAGYQSIPQVFKELIVTLVDSELMDDDYTTLKGGTFQVTRGSPLKSRLSAIKKYVL